jgi:hypothetical protein
VAGIHAKPASSLDVEETEGAAVKNRLQSARGQSAVKLCVKQRFTVNLT